jgi:hypothetical protein
MAATGSRRHTPVVEDSWSGTLVSGCKKAQDFCTKRLELFVKVVQPDKGYRRRTQSIPVKNRCMASPPQFPGLFGILPVGIPTPEKCPGQEKFADLSITLESVDREIRCEEQLYVKM